MQRGVFGCAATAVVLFVSLGHEIAAAAETSESDERGFYLGASVGRVEQEARGEGEMLVGVGPPLGFLVRLQPDQVRVDDKDAGWSVTLGYQINKYLAAELAYYDFGTATVNERYAPSDFPIPLDLTVSSRIEAYGPGVSLLGTLPLAPSLEVIVRGGVLFLDHEAELRISSFRRTQRSGEEIWTAGAGLQWFFTSRWAARLEYQLTDRIERDSNGPTRRIGTTKIEQLSLGVLFDF